ncbi:MAG: putative DNA binding domain-containing protein [Candidatus Omnitrophica bacterium]|nr:putative DNA binding domain-containing protein [Candidatus Omnitrophota bacterium]
MNLERVKLLVKEGEGLSVEFKEKYTSKIDRDIVAFANTRGGVILLGVRDDGKIVGETLTNKLKSAINDLARNCEPSISVKKISKLDKIVVVEIDEGDEKPHSCGSGYFRRLDAVTQKMSQKEVRAIFKETNMVSFESLFSEDFTPADMSLAKIKIFLREARVSYRVNKANLISLLSSLGIFQKDRIKNAGVLMFASKVEKFIPHSEAILIACKGRDKRYIYDRKDVRDDLVAQLNEALMFVRKHLNVRSEIHGVNRRDIYEIPLKALREALVNALIHRDYNMQGTSIYVEVYDDRVVIVNPGGVPSGITKLNFGKESIRRNLVIADLFHRMGMVERVGSGIKKMRDLMNEAGLKEPVFETENFFRVIFPRDPRYSLKREMPGMVGSKGLGKGWEKGLGERVGRKLGKNERCILVAMLENKNVTIQELSGLMGISTTAVENNIKKLKRKKIIKRVGPAKGGHWEVIER